MHPAPSLVSAGANAEPFRAKDGVKKILEAMRIFQCRRSSRKQVKHQEKDDGLRIVRYSVKNAGFEQNRALIAKVFEE